MVQSDVAGIAFSVHPVTEDPDQLIIEAGLGLGEAVVSGQVTPDSYVVRKSDLSILAINISNQKKALYKEGWYELNEHTINGHRRKLTRQQILELSKLIIKIENLYGFPCDIEWALEGETFYITQSRPITTLLHNAGQNVVNDYHQARRILAEYSVMPPFIKKGFHAKFYPIDFVQLIWNAWGDYSGYYYKLHITKSLLTSTFSSMPLRPRYKKPADSNRNSGLRLYLRNM